MEICAVDSCTAPRRARDWCAVHYARWRRHGDPTVVERIYRDDVARFFSHVDQSGECWLWTGQINRSGYGTLRIGGRGAALAHRWSFEHHGRTECRTCMRAHRGGGRHRDR